MKAKYLLILIVLIQSYCIDAQVSYNYKWYTTADGLLSNRCWKLFQDRKGYLWVGHTSGLSKFNGKTFSGVIDKKYQNFWQINYFVENDKNEILCSSTDFVYSLNSKKYVIKDSAFSHYFINGNKDWGLQTREVYLDKDFYRIYSLNRSSNFIKDTLFYSKDGVISSLPMSLKKNNKFNGILKDQNNNVYLNVIDTIENLCSYYLFDRGKLIFLIKCKYDALKLERDLKGNLILFSSIPGTDKSELSVYSKDNKLLKYYTYKALNEAWRGFNCVVDKDNNIWIPTFKGLIKYSEESGIKEYNDPDRNVDKSVVEEFGPDGTAFIVERTVDGNYCHLIMDKKGNLINGDRVFNGHSFNDLLPFSLYPKFGLNEYRSKNKELTKIYSILCDRENNVWMVTDEGLIKFTPVPYRNEQFYLSKNELDFVLKHTDNSGRKFYVKTDDINRFFHVKIYRDTLLLFSKIYKKSPLSSKKGGLQEFLEFYKQGSNTVMYYNSENYNYALCFFDDKEVKRYEFTNTLIKLYSDSLNIIFQEWPDNIIMLNKYRKKEKKFLSDIFSNYCYGYYFSYYFERDNKFLGKKLIVNQVNSNLELDSFPFGNLPTVVRSNLKKVAKINVHGYDLLIVDRDMNYYIANEKKHVKLDVVDKEKINAIINNSEYYFKVLLFKDLFLFSNGSQLVSYKIDSIYHKLTYQSKFTYENGLLVMNGNEFFVNNGYLILHSSGNPFISVFSYENFIKNGLNSPINIKVTRWEDFVVSDLRKYLNDDFFNKQAPIININEIFYSLNSERIIDTSFIHNYNAFISNLTFNYDAVSLTEGDYIQTKYNLLGFDTTWQTIKTNDIVFSSLPPGSYTLQIKACNNHNFWSEPKQVAFSIAYPWYRTWLAYILYFIFGGGAIYLFVKSRTKKLEQEKEKLEKIVEERTAEVVEEKKVITEQKHLIEEKHREITDSINYAERIQRSFLATKEQLDINLKEYFVLFQPKDIVSGDFYWAHTLHNGNFALVTADSTGHGVPGAIMSLLNTSALEKAVESGICEPAQILNHTRKTIIERLKKDGSDEGGKDGMDCSLISFNIEKTKLEYAAANNPIWIVRTNSSLGNVELIELKPDKMPVGKHDKDNLSFTQHTIELQKGDMIYTLTDGFPDQFGGPNGKKYMYKKLKELLMLVSKQSLIEQKEILQKELLDWKGNTEQVDDITVIGVRV